MPLLNYTTSIPAVKSAHEISDKLAKSGATGVLVTYRDGTPIGLTFEIETAAGVRAFRLPVDVGPVQAVLRKQRVERRYQTYEQAERVAWRITKDWVEAQLALIATEMATLDQVMLPYMTDQTGRTIYDLYIDHQLDRQLGPGQ